MKTATVHIYDRYIEIHHSCGLKKTEIIRAGASDRIEEYLLNLCKCGWNIKSISHINTSKTKKK